MKLALIKYVAWCFFIFLFRSDPAFTQICDTKYLSLIYKTSTFDTFPKSIYTPGNEIAVVGRLYDYNSAGHVAKFSVNGTPIWSYAYNLDFFDFIKQIFFKAVNISDIISTADGGFIIAGNVEQVLSPFGSPPPVKKWGLIAKLDKYGNVVWNKTFLNAYPPGELNINNIIKTADGDYIAYMDTDNHRAKSNEDHTYNKIIRFNTDGVIKWSVVLATGLYDAGGLGLSLKRAMTQTADKNIVIGDVVYLPERGINKLKINKSAIRLISLDYATGKKIWEKAYEYPLPATDSLFIPDINDITALPDGKLSIAASLYLSTASHPLFSKKNVTVITSPAGEFEKAVTYYSADGTPCSIISVNTDKITGTKTYLFNKNGEAIISAINNDGNIAWSKGYNDDGGQFPVNCYSSGPKGYNIFMSNNHSLSFRLLITDAAGNVDCANTPATIITETVALNYPEVPDLTGVKMNTVPDYTDWGYPLKKTDFALQKNIQCQQIASCCNDVIDTVNIPEIIICEGSTYSLPDNTVVKDSGTYYVTYKTPLGCDSIKFYHLTIQKDPAKLTLGDDLCFDGKDSLTLNATEGYGTYNWMNSTVHSSSYTAKRAGLYWVRVSNYCGNKIDSVQVFDKCELPVFMPNIFSPNRDKLNDLYRYSKLNQNKFISLRIYNRWGQLIYKTGNIDQGWDGRLNDKDQPTGLYLYYLETETLNGKKVKQKGTFLLSR